MSTIVFAYVAEQRQVQIAGCVETLRLNTRLLMQTTPLDHPFFDVGGLNHFGNIANSPFSRRTKLAGSSS